jgi:ACS family hexuronate transporter-like MFS transporter
MYPRRAVATVIGLGGFAGSGAAFGVQRLTGRLLDATGGDYTIIFAVCGSAYLVALGIIHLLVPEIRPVAIRQTK